MKKRKNLTKAMVEASVMIALATVLGLLKLVDMPYGGSVTFASMLPLAVVAYRHGAPIGFLAGTAYSVINLLLGLNTLSYVTGWRSIVAVIVLDYVFAFAAVGLGGIFKGKFGNGGAREQLAELSTGMGLVCIIRYVMHVISGATVWAGLSIPTEAALLYSIGYNATYMLPETVISVAAAAWIGGAIDFEKSVPTRFTVPRETKRASRIPSARAIALPIVLITVIIEAMLISPHLQDPEDGRFTFALLGEINFVAVTVVLATAVFLCAVALILRFLLKKSACSSENAA